MAQRQSTIYWASVLLMLTLLGLLWGIQSSRSGLTLPSIGKHVPSLPLGQHSRMLPVGPLVMNVADVDSFRFLRLSLALELASPGEAEALRVRMPEVEHAIIVWVASQPSAFLRTEEGKRQLRIAVASRVNAALPHPAVSNVYVSEMLFQ